MTPGVTDRDVAGAGEELAFELQRIDDMIRRELGIQSADDLKRFDIGAAYGAAWTRIWDAVRVELVEANYHALHRVLAVAILRP